jgi:hypothetical protein
VLLGVIKVGFAEGLAEKFDGLVVGLAVYREGNAVLPTVGG